MPGPERRYTPLDERFLGLRFMGKYLRRAELGTQITTLLAIGTWSETQSSIAAIAGVAAAGMGGVADLSAQYVETRAAACREQLMAELDEESSDR